MKTQQDKSKALARLRNALEKIPELKRQGYKSPDFKKWRRNTRVAIEYTFGKESRNVKEFTRIRYTSPVLGDSELSQKSYRGGLNSAHSLLESMIEEVGEYWHDDEVSSSEPIPTEDDEVTVSAPVRRTVSSDTREVFLVYGRDEGAKDTVARFLERLKLSPVILAEQASQGSTIIEKFETHANVSFAIALLTPDDAGSLDSETAAPRPRARQNVIFELGYFIGRLGRKNVCALTKGEVEIPSDYSGVVYVPLDAGEGWKIGLVKELKAAGLNVDANLAL